jgi:two-component system, cell cycle sensor histidine kinase and response regulator CckA
MARVQLVVLALLAAAPVRAEQVLHLSGRSGVLDATWRLELLEDPSGGWTITDVTSPRLASAFRPLSSVVLRQTASVFWCRLSLSGASSTSTWALRLARPAAHTLTAFLPEGPGRWSSRQVTDRVRPALLQLPPATGARQSIYLRLDKIKHVQLSLQVCTLEDCQRGEEGRLLWFGVFYGVMLALSLINLALFVQLRERGHLWLMLFQLSVCALFLVEDGILGRFTSLTAVAELRLGGLSGSMILVWAGIFGRSFLKTRLRAPLADKLSIAYVILGAGLAPLALLGPPGIVRWCMVTLATLAPLVVIGAGVLVWRRGFRPARLYLVAWTVFGFGAFFTALPVACPWGMYAFQAAGLVSALVLALALAERFRELSQERAAAQHARRFAEEALTESARRFHVLFDQAFQFLSLTRPDGTVCEVNRSALDFIGAQADDVRGQPFWQTPWWTHSPQEQARLRESFAAVALGGFVRYECAVGAPDGRRLEIDFSLKPLTDEAGHVALLIAEGRDISDRVHAERSVRRREQMLRVLNTISQRLITASGWEIVAVQNLADLGAAAGVDRVYIFENRQAGNALLTSQRFEWTAAGVTPRLAKGVAVDLSFEASGLRRWVELLGAGEAICGRRHDLPAAEQEMLARQQVRAIAMVPIFAERRWWGFLGFDDCVAERVWSPAELAVLKSAAGIFGVTLEREWAEGALRESEAKYRTIFENAQVGLFRIRAGDGKVLESNAIMARMFGYDGREAFVGEYYLRPNWVCPAERDRLFAELDGGDGVVNNFETQLYRKDRSPFWVRFSARISPERGYLEGVAQDITDEKRTIQELRESESKYRTIFETTGSAMIIFDGQGRITLANREAEKLTGYSVRELEGGKSWRELFPGATGEQIEAHRLRPPSDPAVQHSYEATLVDRQGRERQGIVVVDVIPGTEQRVAGFLDITERRQAERQMLRADKMAALGQIIAGVAHEINNPNNFIYFNLPILRRYIDAMQPMLEHHIAENPALTVLNMPYATFMADVFKLLENMQHGSERITGIVSELKSYIRGHEAEERKQTSVDTIVKHVMMLVGKQVEKMVKRFEVDVEADLPPVVANEGKIEQVLINLIINAGQAADKLDSWVKVAGRRVENARQVELVVEDNGCGIPEEIIDRIFDPFFTTKGRDAGTGLGLSISQRIVEEHGGKLSVSSRAGEGSRFVILLPAGEDLDGARA